MRWLMAGFLGGLFLPGIGGLAFAQADGPESGRPEGGKGPAPAPRSAPRGVVTHVPSQAAGAGGIAVRVVFPTRPRHDDGAPVAIAVRPGSHDENDAGQLNVADSGVAEVYYAAAERAGAAYDFGGPDWILRLRDVIHFALGRTADTTGQSIQDLSAQAPTSGVRVLTSNVGIVGFSHGGNACGAAMGLHGKQVPELAWYVSWERPYGEGWSAER